MTQEFQQCSAKMQTQILENLREAVTQSKALPADQQDESLKAATQSAQEFIDLAV